MIIEINPKTIEFHSEIQALCCHSYYRHPNGCPNYAKKFGCPPAQPLINQILNFQKPIYLVYTEFNLAAHVAEMRWRHPHWTEHQLYCVLYWQSKARVFQRHEERRAVKEYGADYICQGPEASGVNVTKLMRDAAHVILEWLPRQITRLVSLAGSRI